jgi:hypothetical protein
LSLMKEYIDKKMSVHELETELLRLINRYNEYTGSYLVVYAGAIGKQIPDSILSMDDYFILHDVLRNVNSSRLDLYVETLGGDGIAVEEIVRFLRKKFMKINFIVSGTAKSAGTLLVLSGNEIMMTESGSLGPIDAQIKIGRTVISAYDYMEWVDATREEADEKKRLNPFDATMVAQISPGELKLVFHTLQFAKDLVIEWLSKYKFENWNVTQTRGLTVDEEMKRGRAKSIAEELANHAKYRTHGRSIKIDDLERIGLKIVKIDEDRILADTIYRIQTVIWLLFSNTTSYKIFVTDKVKIFKHATPANVLPQAPKAAADAVEATVDCPKCGMRHKLYGKFINNHQIDKEYKAKGIKPFTNNNTLKCDCGFEINLSGIRNEVETRVGKKMVFTE